MQTSEYLTLRASHKRLKGLNPKVGDVIDGMFVKGVVMQSGALVAVILKKQP